MDKLVIRKIHSSSIPSREFHKILLKISQTYGMYPSFRIISPLKNFISEWGEITLPRIPQGDFLHPDEKYYLLLGLGYHSIAPRTEINRLLLRSLVSKIFDVDWKSPTVSWLSALFSAFYSFTSLSRNRKTKEIARDPLIWMRYKITKTQHKSPLTQVVSDYFSYLLSGKCSDENKYIVQRIFDTLSSRIDFESKVSDFFTIIKRLIKFEMKRDALKRSLSEFLISLGNPNKEEKEKTWGRNWRTASNCREKNITPQELMKLAKIDEKHAIEVAKELDKRSDKEERGAKDKISGKLPGYSDRLKLMQKLLSQRRYLAAVRRVRFEKILSALRDKQIGRRKLAMRGQSIWEIGDDESELNIEMSIETFGKLVPNLTTLKNLYEEDNEGRPKRGITHLEVVIDTSGSMNGNPLETAIDVAVAMIEMAKKYEDSIALVTFSSGAWEGIPPSFEYDAVEDIVLRLMADGGTNLRGAIKIVAEHLSQINSLGALILISDTAIWDINRHEVRESLRTWAYKMPVYLIAITDEMYEETRVALKGSLVRLIRVSPNDKSAWEIALDLYETL